MINHYKIKFALPKIGFIVLGWVIAGSFFVFSEYFGIIHFSIPLNINYNIEYNFAEQLITTIITAIVGAAIIGSIEVFYLRDRLRKRSLGSIILIKSLFYTISMFLLITIGTFFYHSFFTGKFFWDSIVVGKVTKHLFSHSFWVQISGWGVVIVITNFVLQVSDKFGQGVLLDYVRGKYHHPKEEERVFMFLDLKSSTTIAESLGHEKYFEFINDYFNDITDPIIFSRGEIYQYIGDEVVVSWKIGNGIHNNNCINCFFDIEFEIHQLRSNYLSKYGIVPEFKAGLHIGKAIVGEVGVIKKEIVFSGDVLNTTSRIQSKCNDYNVKILTSEDIIAKLHLSPTYKALEIGEVTLRGKQTPTHLYSIEKSG
ncbi:MAG: adenylate/guanylate cyclase domain-containing protein [Bacteroidota bacterium]